MKNKLSPGQVLASRSAWLDSLSAGRRAASLASAAAPRDSAAADAAEQHRNRRRRRRQDGYGRGRGRGRGLEYGAEGEDDHVRCEFFHFLLLFNNVLIEFTVFTARKEYFRDKMSISSLRSTKPPSA